MGYYKHCADEPARNHGRHAYCAYFLCPFHMLPQSIDITYKIQVERIIKNFKKGAAERSTKSEVLLIMRPSSIFNLIELE